MRWPMVKLGDCIDILSGYAFKSSEFNSTGEGLPLIRIRDVVPGTSSTYFSGEYSTEYLVNNGDLLVGMDGDFNREKWKNGPALLNQRVCKLSAKPEIISQDYLYHFLPKALDKIHAETPAVTVKHLSVKGIRDIDLALPPLAEQKRIAAILDKADTIRRKRQQAIKLADDLLRAVFLDMFGDPVTNPKGWEVVEVETISNVQGGLQVSSKREPNPLTVPYLRVANVLRDRLDLSEIKEINVNDSELNRVRLLTGDILVVEGHGNPDEIGRAAIWDRYVEDIVHQNHLIRIRPDRSKISSIFLNDFINSSGGRTQMANASNTTSGLNTISTGIVKSTKTILPPLEVQAEYEKVVSKVRKFRMDMAQLLANEMEYLFSSLSQKAFSGEL